MIITIKVILFSCDYTMIRTALKKVAKPGILEQSVSTHEPVSFSPLQHILVMTLPHDFSPIEQVSWPT